PVDGPRDQAAKYLAARTKRWAGLTFMDKVVGSVALDRVVLHRTHRSFHNAFAPVFRGRFSSVLGRTYLSGSFRLLRSTQMFMTVWFCFIVAYCVTAIVVAAGATSKRGTPFWLGVVVGVISTLPGFALGLLGFAFMRLGKRLSKGDVEQI